MVTKQNGGGRCQAGHVTGKSPPESENGRHSVEFKKCTVRFSCLRPLVFVQS